jgi:hypothetical protein
MRTKRIKHCATIGTCPTSSRGRRSARSLTLHDKRVTYVLDDTPRARAAISKHVDTCETEDGEVSRERPRRGQAPPTPSERWQSPWLRSRA